MDTGRSLIVQKVSCAWRLVENSGTGACAFPRLSIDQNRSRFRQQDSSAYVTRSQQTCSTHPSCAYQRNPSTETAGRNLVAGSGLATESGRAFEPVFWIAASGQSASRESADLARVSSASRGRISEIPVGPDADSGAVCAIASARRPIVERGPKWAHGGGTKSAYVYPKTTG